MPSTRPAPPHPTLHLLGQGGTRLAGDEEEKEQEKEVEEEEEEGGGPGEE